MEQNTLEKEDCTEVVVYPIHVEEPNAEVIIDKIPSYEVTFNLENFG